MSPDATPTTYICIVCGEQAEAAMTAECNWCDGRYHLNQRNDVEAKDCGQVWIDEQYLALQFACATCLSGLPGAQTAFAAPGDAAQSAPKRRASAVRPRRYKRRA